MVRMNDAPSNPPTERPDIWYFGMSEGGTSAVLARLPQAQTTVPIEAGRVALRNLANALLIGQFEAILFTTAWGIQRFLETCSRTVDRGRLIDALRDAAVIAGGAGVAECLESLGIEPTLDRPNRASWREILVWLDRYQPVLHWEIAVEATIEVRSLAAGLEARGATVRLWSPIQFDSTWSLGERELLNAIESGECRYVVMDQVESVVRLAQLATSSDGIGLVRVVPKEYRGVASQIDPGPLVTVESFAEMTFQRLDALLPRATDD